VARLWRFAGGAIAGVFGSDYRAFVTW
jgi:hypothetical protein